MKEEEKIDWDKIEKEGKGKIFWLDRYEVLNIFIGEPQETNIFTFIDLPENWRIYGVYYEPSRRAFGFHIFSDEFPATTIGAELPELEQEKVKKVVGCLTRR